MSERKKIFKQFIVSAIVSFTVVLLSFSLISIMLDNNSDIEILNLISIWILLSILIFIYLAFNKKIFGNLLLGNKNLSNKFFNELNYENLVYVAQTFNKIPINRDDFNFLNEIRELIISKSKFDEEEIRLIAHAAKILFNHLEIEFIISPEDPLKLLKINDVLLTNALYKIANSRKNISLENDNSSPTIQLTTEDLEDIMANVTFDKKKLH